MIDFNRVDSRGVVRLYLLARHRKDSIASVLIDDPNEPHPGPASDYGDWEQLIMLMKGVPERAVEALHLKEFGSIGSALVSRPLFPGGFMSYEAWEEADPDTRGPVVWLEEWQAIGPTDQAVAEEMGIGRVQVRELITAAYYTVAENLGNLRARMRLGIE